MLMSTISSRQWSRVVTDDIRGEDGFVFWLGRECTAPGAVRCGEIRPSNLMSQEMRFAEENGGVLQLAP